MKGLTYSCRTCTNHGFDNSIPFDKKEAEETIGTNFARFKTFSEYAWHMKNIHNVDLRNTQADNRGHSVTKLESCNCFSGLWG